MRSRVLCLLAMFASCALAQSIPTLNFKVDPSWPQLPAGWILQETPGIAADRNEHVFVFSRGEHAIIEFDRDGKMIRSFGERVFVRPHGVRFDPEGNL